jgi:hypothetical protein
MRLLVCGGRNYENWDLMKDVLDNFLQNNNIDVLIEGEAKGADSMAREWAEDRGIPVMKFPANWMKYGRAAGPLRNKQMLNDGKPHYAFAFYDRPRAESRGTANMVGQLKAAGIPVEEID